MRYENFSESEDLEEAQVLRAGAPLPDSSRRGPALDAAAWAFDVGRDVLAGVNEGQVDLIEAELQQSEIVSDAIVSGLEMMGEEGADALRRFEAELGEWPELSSRGKFDRVRQAVVAGVISGSYVLAPSLWPLADPKTSLQLLDPFAAVEALAGNREAGGADHPLLRNLPEKYREPLGSLLEKALLPATVGGGAASLVTGAVLGGGITLAAFAAAAVGAGVTLLIGDLHSDDPDTIALLNAVLEDVGGLLDELDPDGEVQRYVFSVISQ